MAAAAAAASVSKSLAKLRRCYGAAPSIPPHRAAFSNSLSSLSSSATAIPPQSVSAPASSSRYHGTQRGSWTKLILFIPGAITFGLGTWQIFRREDKIKMLEHKRKMLGMEPLVWNNIAPSSITLELLDCRRIQCKGVFDDKKSIFLGPRSRMISGSTEKGYFLITPLYPISNDPGRVSAPILVNRGWVPNSWRDKFMEASKHEKEPPGAMPAQVQESNKRSLWRFWAKSPKPVKGGTRVDVAPMEVIGVARGSEPANIFVPSNDPDSSQWFYVDVPAMARACGLPETTIYVEDINEQFDPANPYPFPKDASSLVRSSVMPQDHLNYTLTWYSLSAAMTFMAFKTLNPKKGRKVPAGARMLP